MTDDGTSAQTQLQADHPNPDLKSLDRLVGTWKVSGPDVDGHTTYEWMEGGFFLIQHFDLVHGGRKVKGLEIIGHLQTFGETPSPDIKSRIYDTMGNTFDYVYEIEADTLTYGAARKVLRHITEVRLARMTTPIPGPGCIPVVGMSQP